MLRFENLWNRLQTDCAGAQWRGGARLGSVLCTTQSGGVHRLTGTGGSVWPRLICKTPMRGTERLQRCICLVVERQVVISTGKVLLCLVPHAGEEPHGYV